MLCVEQLALFHLYFTPIAEYSHSRTLVIVISILGCSLAIFLFYYYILGDITMVA